MKIKIFDKEVSISKAEHIEYEKLFDFSDFDFKTNWPFLGSAGVLDEEIYVLCNFFVFRYIQDKSKNRNDSDKIQDWKTYRLMKLSEQMKIGKFPKELHKTLLVLGNISSMIIIRKKIPKIRKTETIFGKDKDLIGLNRTLFINACAMIDKIKKI